MARKITIIRTNAHGTNLVDQEAPVVEVYGFGAPILLTHASSMNGKPATECTDMEIIAAIRGDESVF